MKLEKKNEVLNVTTDLNINDLSALSAFIDKVTALKNSTKININLAINYQVINVENNSGTVGVLGRENVIGNSNILGNSVGRDISLKNRSLTN
jgi:hypothetical protein